MLVREGGLEAVFLAYSNVSVVQTKIPLFPYENSHNFNRSHSTPFRAIPGHSSSYVLTTFLQPVFGLFSLIKISASQLFKKLAQNLSFLSRCAGGIFAAFSHIIGGVMTTTTGQINNIKKVLQQLRTEYLRAADPETKAALEYRIKTHKRLLAELGGIDG